MSTSGGGPNRTAGPMLAAFMSILYAFVPCLLIVTMGSDDPASDWTYLLTCLAVLSFLIYIVRRGVPIGLNDGTYLAYRERRGDPLQGYEARKKVRRRKASYGTQKPITVEEVRAMQESSKATRWVPRKK